ncbi:transcriptional coactivator YAP1-like isoform X1 [Corythoichthys intestinalis]|uniref:transcriptional coactivator YAP1-like isoform X1 n=1 Tax=Corythoichthys intestinalis TaxID=161448 RepID=UPI0025A59C89|nr:transcriptional coactivator YAP1-like isoform X1 [Corythoichthys intestinalis]XP_061801660.1 transcriptional coactivator YAP1-like [Nerophis lumbriciformis]
MDAHRGGGGSAPPVGQQVVHVRGDSQSELDALFSAVMNPGKAAQQPASVPMRLRKLPDSFFKPPDPRTHSRQASSDGGVCASLTPHHVRAHSSPASLPVNMPDAVVAAAAAAATAAATAPFIPDDVPLPHGWEMAKTPAGQRYFLNHLDKTTTWHDPRLTQLQSTAQPHPGPSPAHAHSLSNPAPTTATPPSSNPDAGGLPDGWERATTAEGDVYYVDHINKSTTWLHPRLGLLSLVMQQRKEKERQRCKQHMQLNTQDTIGGGRNQMPAAMDHDRNTLAPPVDVRIRAPTHEPTLNGGAHSRNESTDSGLSVSSLPRSSELALASLDHMDTGECGESSTLQDSLPTMSEGEELMPCIPEGLSSDLLMDMETVLSGSHMDRDSLLTWL